MGTRRSRKGMLLTFKMLACIPLLVSCASDPHIPIDIPTRPLLPVVTQDVWSSMNPDAQAIFSDRDLIRACHIKRLECLIAVHNGDECDPTDCR